MPTRKLWFLVKRSVGKQKFIVFSFPSVRSGKKFKFFVPKAIAEAIVHSFFLAERSLNEKIIIFGWKSFRWMKNLCFLELKNVGFEFYCYFESVLLALFNSSSSQFRDFARQGCFLFLKTQAKPKEKVETSLAPTGGNILTLFGADVEGRREHGLLKMPKRFAPNKKTFLQKETFFF